MSDGLARLMHLMRDHHPPKREHGFHKPVSHVGAMIVTAAWFVVILGMVLFAPHR